MKEVVCRFGTITALDHVSLAVEKGEVVCIIGPSGSGKSTLLRCLNALEDIQEGSIEIEGLRIDRQHQDIHKIRLEVGMVFQQFNLFPHLTTIANISLAQIVVRGRSKEEALRVSSELLAKVG